MFASSFSRSFRQGERPFISTTQIAATADIWYDAASPAYFQPTNPTNGASLTQWNDRSNAAHNAGPSGGANKPTYVTPAQNGYGAVRFTGTQNLQITNTTWAASKAGFGQFVVARLNNNTTGTRTLTQSDTNGFKIQYNTGTWTVGTAGGTATTAITADTGWHIFTLLFDGAGSTNSDKLKFRYDSTDRSLFFSSNVGATTAAGTSKLNFGWDGSGNYWLGDIAEVLLFTSAQNSTQVGLIEGYLKNKWGI
jgi:hypothetical protein